ncbi:hypothetical protein QWZ16_23795 [Vibrio ostreicida]|uniref:Uncharacterized protein n=1 Tax=Vibrio ostreicida TaxID=526588 RepID=A0ABT8C2P5_9VIBR|nr:hypothetical protein [Vibrio ostreicida]MDN3612623.1 hypothetical protein [Vibrio ostreicida]
MEDKLILNLVDVALKGDKSTAQMIVRKLASKIRLENTSLYEQMAQRLASDALRSSNVRRMPPPVDSDSRQSLIKVEVPTLLSKSPIYSDSVSDVFDQVLLERKYVDALLSEGLQPTKSLYSRGLQV